MNAPSPRPQVRHMRRACVVAFVGLVLTAGAARGDDRIDVGLLLGSTRATDEGAALQFGRALTYQALVRMSMGQTDGLKKMRIMRKDLARVYTEMRARELAAVPKG